MIVNPELIRSISVDHEGIHNRFAAGDALTKRAKVVSVHLAIWLLYIFYESSILFIIDNAYVNVWEVLLNFSLYACIFYANSLVILPKFLVQKRYFLLLLNVALIIALVIPTRYAIYFFVLPHLDERVLHPFTTDKLFLAQSLWRSGYFAMLSCGYFFAVHSIKVERQKRRLADARRKREREFRRVEKELMEMEITSLKNQINPHFLYNTLNFFYSQVYSLSENTAKGILLLSDIMRYALGEDEGNGKVMLEKEVAHLQNYINLNQLRYNGKLQLQFHLDGILEYKMIIPMVLITLVENCFKYGELTDPSDPVVITMQVENDRLFFSTYNRKRVTTFKEKSTGIGLVNIRRRLDLKCPNRYSLEAKNGETHYTCTLSMYL